MRIAIFAYKFPPFAGVAANRWDNLSREMANLGEDVTVFTVRWGINREQCKEQVDEKPTVDIIKTKSGSFHRLRNYQSKYRNLNRLKTFLFKVTDNIFSKIDEANDWSKHLFEAFEGQHVGKPFDVVIVTGAPFSTILTASKVKQRYDSLKLVIDFRDPFWSMDTEVPVNPRDLALLKKLKKAASHADLILTVSLSLAEIYKTILKKDVHCFTNGFQEEAIKQILSKKYTVKNQTSSRCISLIHNGNLTNGRADTLIIFLRKLSLISCGVCIELTLQGYVSPKIERRISEIKTNIKIHVKPPTSKIESLRSVFEADICLHIGAKNTPFALSTKIFEYMALRRPVVSLNFGGDIEALLVNYKPSLSLNFIKNPNMIEFLEFLEKIKTPSLTRNNINRYSYSSIASNLRDRISSC